MAGITIPVAADTKQAESSVLSLGTALGGIGAVAAVGFAAATAAIIGTGVAIFNISKEVAALGDDFNKMSGRTGIAVETLSALAFVAGQAGTDIQTIEKALKTGAKSLREADIGSKKYADALDQMGISTRDASGELRSVDSLLLEVADAFVGIENDTVKAALAQDIFGGAGTKLIPLLNQGADAIREQMQEAKDLGVVFSEVAANESAEFVDAQGRIAGAVQGVKNAFVSELIPAITPALNTMAELISNSRDEALALGLAVVDSVGAIVKVIGRTLPRAIKFIGTMTLGFKGLRIESLKNEIRFKSMALDLKKLQGKFIDNTEEVDALSRELADLNRHQLRVTLSAQEQIRTMEDTEQAADDLGVQIEAIGQQLQDSAADARELADANENALSPSIVTVTDEMRDQGVEMVALNGVMVVATAETIKLADAERDELAKEMAAATAVIQAQVPWINEMITGYSGTTLALVELGLEFDAVSINIAEMTGNITEQVTELPKAVDLWSDLGDEMLDAAAAAAGVAEELDNVDTSAADATAEIEKLINKAIGQKGGGPGMPRVNELAGQMVELFRSGASAADFMKLALDLALTLIINLLSRLIAKLFLAIDLMAILGGLFGFGPPGGTPAFPANDQKSPFISGLIDDLDSLTNKAKATARNTREAILSTFNDTEITIPVRLELVNADQIADNLALGIMQRLEEGSALAITFLLIGGMLV